MSPSLPDWAIWNFDSGRPAWTVGIEEEVMLLDPRDWALAHQIDMLLPELPQRLAGSVSAETHACTLELATGVHATVRSAAAELYSLRVALAGSWSGSACGQPSPGPTRWRSGTMSRCPGAPATSCCTRACACWPGASRPSRSMCTSASRPLNWRCAPPTGCARTCR